MHAHDNRTCTLPRKWSFVFCCKSTRPRIQSKGQLRSRAQGKGREKLTGTFQNHEVETNVLDGCYSCRCSMHLTVSHLRACDALPGSQLDGSSRVTMLASFLALTTRTAAVAFAT